MNLNLSKFSFIAVLFISFVIFADKGKTVNFKNAEPTKPQNSKKAVAPKIAYVNIHKIITLDSRVLEKASSEWKDLYNKLQETIKPADKELEEIQKDFENRRQEGIALQKSQVVSQEALRRKYEELAELDANLRKRIQDREQFLQNELNKFQNQVGLKIEDAIKKIKQSQGWDMILRGEVILLSDPSFDLTDQVLEMINKTYAEEKKKKEAETKVQQATKEPLKLS